MTLQTATLPLVEDDGALPSSLGFDACPGTPTIAGYELREELGRGGSGVVYRARQLQPEREVALKLIRERRIASARERERFLVEGAIASRLEHPGIVPVHEVGESGGVHFYTMALVEGGNLAERLCEGPLEPGKAAELLTELASAVAYAHERGIVHRDLKPENVLFDETSNARITDFGLARDIGDGRRLTLSGEIVGTPAYMAPEQVNGDQSVGPTADLYALGGILYTCLTGGPPFRAATLIATLRQIVDKLPVPPRLANPAVPRELDAICMKCLEKDPERRYSGALELAADLRAFLDGGAVAADDGQTNAFLRVLLLESRHTDVMARWSRIGMLHAGLFFTLFLATGVLVQLEAGPVWPYLALWIPGWIGATLAPVALRAFGGALSRVERQLTQVWVMLSVTVGLTAAFLLLRGETALDLVPVALVEGALGIGAMSVILGGSFYTLAIACAVSAVTIALSPSWAIAPVGMLLALAHHGIARRAGRLRDGAPTSAASPCAR